jgi:hypothetical protein
MSGYDAPFHMSEECTNAQIAVPRAIAFTSTTGAISGWALLLVVAYTAVDVTLVATGAQPFITWLFQVVHPTTATAFSTLAIITGCHPFQSYERSNICAGSCAPKDVPFRHLGCATLSRGITSCPCLAGLRR